MAERTVKRVITRSTRRTESQGFRFTPEMIPSQNGRGANFVKTYRSQAWDAYNKLPFPHTKLEPWRRTSLRKLNADGFELPAEGAYKDLPPVPEELRHPLAGDEHGGLIVLKPGGSEVFLSEALASQGVVFTDYATAEREYPELLEKIMGKVVRPDEGKFAALSASLAEAGVLLYVPRNVEVQAPLHSVIWAPGVGLAHLSHVMIYVEDGASVTYVHESASPNEDGQVLNASTVEGWVGANASLRFVELQSLGTNVWNFTHERIKTQRDGNVDWIFGAIGTHMTKNFSDLDLDGTGAHGRMSGFYFTDGVQHLDHDTQQNHNAPNTTSDLLFKGALKDNSRSVWQGMIFVAKDAQKTDGYQANRNLILEPTARADSIPGLEILADDVRCTHGATVGKIDPEMLYYLESRGVPTSDAERLIVEGFFAPIMDRIPFEEVRARFEQAILDKMA